MTNKQDVSFKRNNFFDSQRIGETVLNIEQDRNVKTDSSIISNHIGTGILLEDLVPKIIFDSDNLTLEQAEILAVSEFDGTGLSPHDQPSDSILGNQLSIELKNSNVWGRFSVKVAIIGLDFEGNIQSDKFIFHRNAKYITKKHYAKIISILFNDFKGNSNCSRNWGGTILIKEANSFEFSIDSIMVSADINPDIFWRDFKTANSIITLEQTLQNAIGSQYTVDSLNINTTGLDPKQLQEGDVVSKVGQKFIGKTDNIQKITLLLGALKNENVPEENLYDWSGDLIISLYDLQSTISCPSDIIPKLKIDFDPSQNPLVQISFNQASLRDYGYVLTDILQPVDFVFSSSLIGKGNIKIGNYYAVVLNRSGNSDTGNILIGCGSNLNEDTRISLFNSSWVDIPEETLWFKIWTDAIKLSDGKAYESGNGIQINKTIENDLGTQVDYSFDFKSFSNTGEEVVNYGIIKSVENSFSKIQNEQSGNKVNTLKQFVPQFDFVLETELTDLQKIINPLIVGSIKDSNPKNNPSLEKIQIYPGLAKNDVFCIVNPDPDLLSLNLIGSKLIPNSDCKRKDYKIYKTTLCTDGYGDLNSDGNIDMEDIARITSLIGESIYFETTQQKIVNGEIDTIELLKADLDGDGYITSSDADLLTDYVNKKINSFPVGSSFTHLCLQVQQSIGRLDGYFDCGNFVRLDGYFGVNIINPANLDNFQLEYDGYNAAVQIASDPVFSQVPFLPVTFEVIAQPFWEDYFLNYSAGTKFVPAIFETNESLIENKCEEIVDLCDDLFFAKPPLKIGRNDFFAPDNIYFRGQLKRPDGSFYPIDFEVGTIVLELPEIVFNETNINIFDKLVVGKMKYADCSLVEKDDLLKGQVRFGLAIASFYKNLDGYSSAEDFGAILDPEIGCYMDNLTGILTLNVSNLAVDNIFKTLVTKIQIQVFLKKGGFNNQTIIIGPNQVAGLIS